MIRLLCLCALVSIAGCATSREPGGETPAKGEAGPAPGATPDAPFRAQKPPALAREPHFEAPVPLVRKLKNGVGLLVSPNPNLPLVSLEVTIKTGINGDLPHKAGLAELTSQMLDEGTQRRTAIQIAEELEDLAAEYSAGAGPQTLRVQMNCLSQTLPQCVDLLADMVQHPAFRPEDVERVRGLQLTALARKKGSATALAEDEVARILYGESHPWGQPQGGTPASVKSISRDDLAAYHQRWFHPNNATIVAVGDVDPAQLVALLDEKLGGWKVKPLKPINLPPFPASVRNITLIDKPGTSQSQVWVAGRLFPATDPDAVPMRVANYVLGGLFTSRLNLNLRETHAYSYGVRSHVTLLRTTGLFVASGGIVSKNTADAVTEYERELSRFATGDVTEEELSRAKEAYTRSLPSALETDDAVAGALSNLDALGLPLDYFRTLPARIAAVTRPDVARVAQAHVRPRTWPIVVVGPKAEIEAPLGQLDFGRLIERPLDAAVAQQ